MESFRYERNLFRLHHAGTSLLSALFKRFYVMESQAIVDLGMLLVLQISSNAHGFCFGKYVNIKGVY